MTMKKGKIPNQNRYADNLSVITTCISNWTVDIKRTAMLVWTCQSQKSTKKPQKLLFLSVK